MEAGRNSADTTYMPNMLSTDDSSLNFNRLGLLNVKFEKFI